MMIESLFIFKWQKHITVKEYYLDVGIDLSSRKIPLYCYNYAIFGDKYDLI